MRKLEEAHTLLGTQRRQKQVDSILKPNGKKPPLRKRPHRDATLRGGRAASWPEDIPGHRLQCAAASGVRAAGRPTVQQRQALIPRQGAGRSPRAPSWEEGRRGLGQAPRL